MEVGAVQSSAASSSGSSLGPSPSMAETVVDAGRVIRAMQRQLESAEVEKDRPVSYDQDWSASWNWSCPEERTWNPEEEWQDGVEPQNSRLSMRADYLKEDWSPYAGYVAGEVEDGEIVA